LVKGKTGFGGVGFVLIASRHPGGKDWEKQQITPPVGDSWDPITQVAQPLNEPSMSRLVPGFLHASRWPIAAAQPLARQMQFRGNKVETQAAFSPASSHHEDWQPGRASSNVVGGNGTL
jgi:hypothetical protein